MSDELRQTYCERCQALIVFIRTENGKHMPCDANPVNYRENAEGDHYVFTRYGKRVRCDIVTDNGDFTGLGYVPHWGNCLSYEGRKRMAAYNEQAKKKEEAKYRPPVKAAPAPVKREEPKHEQMSLFGGDRPYRHPM